MGFVFGPEGRQGFEIYWKVRGICIFVACRVYIFKKILVLSEVFVDDF